MDADHLHQDYYEEIFHNNSIITNKFSKKYFSTYLQNVKTFYIDIFESWIFRINILFMFILFVISIHKKYKFRFIISLLFIFGLPVIFQLYLTFPTEVMVTIFCFILFCLIIYTIANNQPINKAIVFKFHL